MRTLILLFAALAFTACTESAPIEQATESNEAPESVHRYPTRSAISLVHSLKTYRRVMPSAPCRDLGVFWRRARYDRGWALPGGGWYSKLLLPYLGDDGALIGAGYTVDMLRLFGFYSEERLKEMETWDTDWPANASTWVEGNNTPISAFFFGSMPEDTAGSADVVLFIRALHNLARFEDQGGYLTSALADAYATLKPGGVVGVVQHQMREEAPDTWAQGNRGYLKQSFVIAQMEQAGFVLEGASDINANPKDLPEDGDVVWRLPPSLSGSRDDPEAAAAMQAIGESNRMTLLFRKPTA